MTPYKWPVLTAVPQTLEKRLEIMRAIQTLARQDEDLRIRQQQAEVAARRRLIAQLELTVHDLRRSCDPRLRSRVLKYDPDQPRVPAGNPHGGEWTSEDGSGTSSDSTGSSGNTPDANRGNDPTLAAPANDSRVLSDATPDNAWIPGARYAGGVEEDENENRMGGDATGGTLREQARLQSAQVEWETWTLGS